MIIQEETYLAHYGVLGMKWGKRKNKANYRSTSIRSAIARRQNEKVDKSFDNWKENAAKKEKAIELGKKANERKMVYEKDRSNKTAKNEYKQAEKEYKKALRSNTTYRKGAVKQSVGSDLSRKYLSEAKRIKKQLDKDPTNKKLKKDYADYMSKHDIERAKARKAPEKAANRSNKIASIKRTMTMSAKGVATAAAIGTGAHFANSYLKNHDVRLNGRPIRINTDAFRSAVEVGKKVFRYF